MVRGIVALKVRSFQLRNIITKCLVVYRYIFWLTNRVRNSLRLGVSKGWFGLSAEECVAEPVVWSHNALAPLFQQHQKLKIKRSTVLDFSEEDYVRVATCLGASSPSDQRSWGRLVRAREVRDSVDSHIVQDGCVVLLIDWFNRLISQQNDNGWVEINSI